MQKQSGQRLIQSFIDAYIACFTLQEQQKYTTQPEIGYDKTYRVLLQRQKIPGNGLGKHNHNRLRARSHVYPATAAPAGPQQSADQPANSSCAVQPSPHQLRLLCHVTAGQKHMQPSVRGFAIQRRQCGSASGRHALDHSTIPRVQLRSLQSSITTRTI